MSVRERILIIRLMNKLERYRQYAQTNGTEESGPAEDQNARNQLKGTTTA